MRKTFWARDDEGAVWEYYEDTGERLPHQIRLPDQPKHIYSSQMADLIAQKLVEGIPLSTICKEPGFPSLHLVSRWRRIYPEFNDTINAAKRSRAELLRDQALSTATAPLEKDDVPAAKLAVDTLKWAAEKDDPETFGNRTKIEGTVGIVQLVIETGIRRTASPTTQKIQEAFEAELDSHIASTPQVTPTEIDNLQAEKLEESDASHEANLHDGNSDSDN